MDNQTLWLLERIATALENLVALKVIDATIAVNGASPALQLKVPALMTVGTPPPTNLGSVPAPVGVPIGPPVIVPGG